MIDQLWNIPYQQPLGVDFWWVKQALKSGQKHKEGNDHQENAINVAR